MCPRLEVAHTVPLRYEPTHFPGGTQTCSKGALAPSPPYPVYGGVCFCLCVLA